MTSVISKRCSFRFPFKREILEFLKSYVGGSAVHAGDKRSYAILIGFPYLYLVDNCKP